MAEALSNQSTMKEKVKVMREDHLTGPFSDPVFKQIAIHNGAINRMTKGDLQQKLETLNLDTRGVKEVLKKRLKNHYKKTKLMKAKIQPSGDIEQSYDYLLVIDFEATCEEYNPHGFDYEIIEFPVVLIDVEERKVISEFHEYVKPIKNPHLSDFCVMLTGIQQETVDSACTFPEVLTRMETWMTEHRLGTDHKFAVVTDGPWDMSRFMHLQCATSKIAFPLWAKKWINIRKSYSNYYGFKRVKLSVMLENLGMTFEGQQHSGIDDARNIGRIVIHMLNDGFMMRINERLYAGKDRQKNKVEAVSKRQAEMSDDEEVNECQGCCGENGKVKGEGSEEVSSMMQELHVRSRSPSPNDDMEDLLSYYALQNNNQRYPVCK